MQKRLVRLGTADQIRKGLGEFIGKKINIVLTDNTVILASLLKFSDADVQARNMRGQKLSLPLADIYEIIIDVND